MVVALFAVVVDVAGVELVVLVDLLLLVTWLELVEAGVVVEEDVLLLAVVVDVEVEEVLVPVLLRAVCALRSVVKDAIAMARAPVSAILIRFLISVKGYCLYK